MANSDMFGSNEKTLLVSTLDGALHSINKATGTVKWSLKTSKYCSFNILRAIHSPIVNEDHLHLFSL